MSQSAPPMAMSSYERAQAFHALAREAAAELFGEPFDTEVSIEIGAPPHPHRFDLASRSRAFVGEVKSYTWTSSGNVPSAKISHLREALMYLRALPASSRGFLVCRQSPHPRTGETLLSYFARLNPQWIGGVELYEMPEGGSHLRKVK
jgi:hypothetical protein